MRKIYSRQFLLFVTLSFISPQIFAQLYSITFTGSSACPTPGNTPVLLPNTTATGLTRSTLTCTPVANVFNSTTINNTAAVNDNSYIEFSVTANPGYQLNVNALRFFIQGSGTAPNQLEVRYSTDGFLSSTSWGAAPNTTTSPGATNTWDFPDFTTALGATVTFRIYPYGTQRANGGTPPASSTATLRINRVVLDGSVFEPMPVKLISFKGSYEQNTIKLKWETAWEEQNQGFEIQKSPDAVHFEQIGFVEGKSTTKAKSTYIFADNEIQTSEKVYYRIKQVDFDGNFEFSRIISVTLVSEQETAVAYPNPSHGSFTVSMKNTALNTIQFYNAHGFAIPFTSAPAESVDGLLIQPKHNLPPGLYYIKVNTDNAPGQKTLTVLIE